MDLFKGPVGSNQVHDLNPGIAGNGLFWTTAFARQNVAVDLEHGRASMFGIDHAVPDYHDILNSLGVTQPPLTPVPSRASFQVHWHAKPGVQLVPLRNTTSKFEGRFMDCTASIAFTASQSSTGFAFTSDPATTSTSVSGVIGYERTGRFFGSGLHDD
jgi:hypothetical protein